MALQPRLSRLSIAVLATAFVTGATTAQVAFTDVTKSTGVNFVHNDNVTTMSGGVCLIDYDDDGFPDLYATSSNGSRNKLFHNNRNGTFTDVSVAAGVDLKLETTGAYAADFDNDGDQDLLVLTIGKTVLYRNDANGKFTDLSKTAGIHVPHMAMAATFADYDRDGDLDIYIGNYVEDGFFPYFDGGPNLLFRNDGQLKFTEIGKAAGVDGRYRFWDPRKFWRTTYCTTLSTLFFDYDRDGWPDLFVGNDFGPFIIPDLLYRNNGDGTFTEIGQQAGFRIAEFNMGLATADVNGDLLPDLYTTNLGDNHLLFNDGRGRLSEVGPIWNALEGKSGGKLLTSWACMFFDCDLDCRPDLYVSNGYIQTVPAMDNDRLAPSRLLHHTGKTYQHVPTTQFKWDRGVGRGAARGDLDGDGDEDLVQMNNKQALKIYRNDTKSGNHFAVLDLVGSLSNRDGIGAYVVLRTRQTAQAFDYNRGGSYLSGNAAPIVAGLGIDRSVAEVAVEWPSGVKSRVFDLAGSKRHELREPTVTQSAIGKFKGIGASYLEIPVTVHNHAKIAEKTSFSVELSLGSQRATIPAYYFPLTLKANETKSTSVYVPIPVSALPIARQLGVWIKIVATSRNAARDEHTLPLR